jgi:hypothetical protein
MAAAANPRAQVPRRVRVIIQRKRNDDDDAKVRRGPGQQREGSSAALAPLPRFLRAHPGFTQEDLYSYVTVAAEQNFAGLGTKQLE